MGSAKTHPHIERPSEEQLRAVVENKSPIVRELYLETHRLVVETLPDVKYCVDCQDGAIGYGVHQYGYNGWGMAGLTPHTKWVTLGFLRGVDLADPAGMLEGTSSMIRHVKVRSLEQLADVRDSLRGFVAAAAHCNER